MLFTLCTNLLNIKQSLYYHLCRRLLVVLMVLSISACSINSVDDNNSDMVDSSVNSLPQLNENPLNINLAQQQGNSFSEKKDEKMQDVPLVVIEIYNKAIRSMTKKNWQAASDLFDQVIVKQPQLSGSYVNKALIAKHQQHVKKAREYIDKAISVNHLNPYAHHIKGQLLKSEGDFLQAEQSYLTALNIWPNYAEVHVSMAVLLELYRGKLLDAYRYYQSYLVLQPKDIEVQRWFAGLKIKLKRAGLTPVSNKSKTENKQEGD